MHKTTQSKIVRPRRALLIASSCVFLGVANPAMADDDATKIQTIRLDFADKNANVTLPVATRLSGEITFNVSGTKSGAIEIYSDGVPDELRTQNSCSLNVVDNKAVFKASDNNKNCAILTTAGELGSPLNISPRGEKKSIKMTFERFLPAPGPQIESTNPPKFITGTISPQCYIQENPTQWRIVACKKADNQEVSDDLAKYIKAKGDKGEKAIIVTYDKDAHVWHKVHIVAPTAPTLVGNNIIADLMSECTQQLKKDAGKTDAGPMYVLCVDVNNFRAPSSILLYRRSTNDPFEKAEYPLQIKVRAQMVVYAWHDNSGCPKIDPSTQDEGIDTIQYTGGGIQTEFGKSTDCPMPVRREIGAQKGDKLVIDVTATQEGKQPLKYTRSFVVEKQYWTALRLGLGVSWSPWARDFAVRTTLAGTKYAAITHGDGTIPGIFEPEMFVSYSIFTKPMSNLHPELGFGFHGGIGFLAANSKGIDGLTALRLGVELNYGLDFSLGLSFGIRRYDVPKEEFQPGAPLPNTVQQIDTTPGITPNIGLVLNMTPNILKTVGITVK